MGGTRVVLEVEVQSGKPTAAHHALPGLWPLWETPPAAARPCLVRGDCQFGQEGVLAEAEARGQDDWFKLRLSRRPKDLIRQRERTGQWRDARQGWQGRAGERRWQGWRRARREAITRRPLRLHALARRSTHAGQTVIRVTPLHAAEPKIRKMLTELSQFLATLQATAQPLTCGERGCRILSRAFRPLLGEVELEMPAGAGAKG